MAMQSEKTQRAGNEMSGFSNSLLGRRATVSKHSDPQGVLSGSTDFNYLNHLDSFPTASARGADAGIVNLLMRCLCLLVCRRSRPQDS